MPPHSAPPATQSISKPLLPPDFIQSIESTFNANLRNVSQVYTADRHEFRLELRNWTSPSSPDSYWIEPDSYGGFTYRARRSFLHHAAMTGDVLGLCELLYCGATADFPDADGFTPLFVTLVEPARFHRPEIARKLNYKGIHIHLSAHPSEKAAATYSYIAGILIEQDVDVNQELHGVSLLELACISKDWETVTLLLQHGASDFISGRKTLFETIFPVSSDRNRFSSLIEKHKYRPESWKRPPRKCPCWSGKVVAECHGKQGARIAYPDGYVCPCGTGKTYLHCCSRKRGWVEYWNGSTNRLEHKVPLPEGMEEMVKQMAALVGPLDSLPTRDFGFPHPVDGRSPEEATAFGEKAVRLGLVDPAFGYAMIRYSDMHPMPGPWTKELPREVMKNTHEKWNKLVDDYIALGTDERSAFEIQAAAKIGTYGGAYSRICEGTGCGKREFSGEPKVKLSVCAKCRLAPYCSSECQKSDWENHKKVCKKPKTPQMLPSQKSLLNYAMNSDDFPE